MSSRSKSKKRSIDQVTDGAIMVAKGGRDASDSIPVLTPLRGSLGMVIQLLENVKKVRTNKEDWVSLAQTLEGRLKAVQDAIAGKPPSAVLQNLVSKYSEVLERATRELGPLVEGQANWLRAALSADRESKKIKDSIKEIDEAFNLFTRVRSTNMTSG
ncbi:hypothetical protein CPB86DRAFT_795854 [Serendipita vermifera]|nr:hypothetical protein CPB86DRAFT_795854 [Serendipita vermifera]